MYAADHASNIRGVIRQVGAMAADPKLDPEDLTDTFGPIEQAVEAARAAAVVNLRRRGFSWAQIAAGMGVSRQAAQKRYGSTR